MSQISFYQKTLVVRCDVKKALNAEIRPGYTVTHHFETLFQKIWEEQTNFDLNVIENGWSFDLTFCLLECGYIPGKKVGNKEYRYSVVQANELIRELIHFCFFGEK